MQTCGLPMVRLDENQRRSISMGKKSKRENRISAVIVRRGIWRSNPTYRSVFDESGFIPFDILVMNMYDQLVPSGGATFWQMKATSNGSFFLFPMKDKKKPVEIISPNGHRACVSSETSGLVATLFVLRSIGSGEAAGRAFIRLIEYARQQRQFPSVDCLVAGL